MNSIKFLKLFILSILMVFLSNDLAFALSDNVILYDQTRHQINPFEMYSFSIGVGNGRSHRSSDTKKDEYKYYEFKIGAPLYKKYLDLGFEYSFVTKNIIGNEYTFSLKFKLPFHLPVGDIALTNSYRLGLVNAIFQEKEDITYFRSLGGMGAIGVGIEYFPVRWVGVFVEQSLRRYAFRLNKLEDDRKVNRALSFNVSVTTFGVKFTF